MDVLCYCTKDWSGADLRFPRSSWPFLKLSVTSAQLSGTSPKHHDFLQMAAASQAYQLYLSAPADESHPALWISIHCLLSSFPYSTGACRDLEAGFPWDKKTLSTSAFSVLSITRFSAIQKWMQIFSEFLFTSVMPVKSHLVSFYVPLQF